MIPTKYASSDTNNAESPRNETTRLRALATGLRLMTTAAPKISVISAKIQKRNGDIGYWSDGVMDFWSNGVMELRFLPTLHYSKSPLFQRGSFLLVPLQHHALDNPADFEQLFFVMHHFRAREAGDGIIFPQKNRLLGANLLAHPAENAADHVDIELLGIFLDFGEAIF